LIEPVDDLRDTNPPSNPQLLDALAAHLVDRKFSAADLIRAITASSAYQRSSHPNATNADDTLNYSRAQLKRLDAEVLLDAVCQATGVPERLDGAPYGERAIRLWDNRSMHYFLALFGRPTRLTPCECERSVEPSVSQVLHFLNGPDLHGKLTHAGGAVARLVRESNDDVHLAEELYLAFYSRLPTEEERQTVVAHLQRGVQNGAGGRRAAAEDIAWSLLNSLEFVFNH
jgi:hypothetical protein